MPSYKTNAQIVEEVNQAFAYQLEQVRRDTTRTPDWKTESIAKIYTDMRAAIDEQTSARDATRAKDKRNLEQRVFGSGSSSTDGALAISRRDAGDRASQLDTPQEALDLLRRAERTGDEPLARAVAERAFELRWVDVINEFLVHRPKLEDDVTALWNEHTPSLAEELRESFGLYAKPPELSGMSDHAIQLLASSKSPA